MPLLLSEYVFFLRKNFANKRKNWVFSKTRWRRQTRLRNCVEVSKATNVNIYSLTLWYSVPRVQEIGNCAILFKRLLHEKEATLRFTF